MILAPDPRQVQHLLPDRGQGGFGSALRGLVFTAKQRRLIRRRQGLAVELAVGGQGQGVEPYISHRHHVVRQLRQQVGAQLRHVQGDILLLGEIGHQPRVARLILAGQQHRFLDTGELAKTGLDFPQLDAHAADLHLIVVAPR